MGLLDKLKKTTESVSGVAGKKGRKVMVIGLDCAPPEHIFDEYKDEIPNLAKLVDNGMFGPLQSITPPITVPAWACMMTSKDPGTLGIYGFRNRKDHTYDGLEFATSFKVKEPAVWDILSEAGKDCIVMSVPPTIVGKSRISRFRRIRGNGRGARESCSRALSRWLRYRCASPSVSTNSPG